MKKGISRIGVEISVKTAQFMCFVKRAWNSRNEARDFAKRGEKSGFSSTTVYKCKLCSKWHLTSLSKADSQAVRKHIFMRNK